MAKRQAKVILAFIAKYEPFNDKQAKAFSGVEEFNMFRDMVVKMKMEDKIELDNLKKEVMV